MKNDTECLKELHKAGKWNLMITQLTAEPVTQETFPIRAMPALSSSSRVKHHQNGAPATTVLELALSQPAISEERIF